jgi:CDP-diacylglycerol--glycerol-3-phosphate 3-phosphatidyltransferase
VVTLGSKGRGFATAVFGPVAALLVRLRVSPDVVTAAGTLAVMACALGLFPSGRLALGAVLVGACALTDTIDGQMARRLGRTGPWGAFLDSTLDRFADGAIFAGLVLWGAARAGDGAGPNDPAWAAGAALAGLVLGSIVPYARARAEGLGMTASVGIAERTDRLVVTLVATLAVGLGAPVAVLTLALALLALASAVTVAQRMVTVYRQATTAPGPAAAAPGGQGRPA